MCRFIETMRVSGSRIENVSYHNRRMNLTRQHFRPGCQPVDLAKEFTLTPEHEGFKARVVYDGSGIIEKSLTPYSMRKIRTLRIVDGGDIDYRFKSADRSALNRLMEQRGECDDIIIVKNGLLTDTSFTNVALFDGVQWLTPRCPLLKGTRRAALLDNGQISEADIPLSSLRKFSRIRLFNAMIPFGQLELDINNIVEQ